ncbi:hypothetical protein BS50DRAFT_363486 [Corynespora cassiicola Philippines]|uniref:Secreted protein n=1 Tax=Corynespora cassiicola Philippines TaxID=1448308 RepID=A0A2T2NT14_CORCC|nr:hypothetical protein BS50DRAFT_363486 [Corynespora cassiicola Philippines]
MGQLIEIFSVCWLLPCHAPLLSDAISLRIPDSSRPNHDAHMHLRRCVVTKSLAQVCVSDQHRTHEPLGPIPKWSIRIYRASRFFWAGDEARANGLAASFLQVDPEKLAGVG